MKKEAKRVRDLRSAADILAANVARLVEVYRDPVGVPPPKSPTGRRLAVPALGRIQRKPSYETVETLELLTEVFRVHVPGLEAWMLLYPDLDPQRLPICVADHERDLLRRIRSFAPKQASALSKSAAAAKRSAQVEPPATQSNHTPPEATSLSQE